MYITPFSPRAAYFCIISLILPSLGGREDPQFTDAGERRGKEERREGGRKEGRSWPSVSHLVTEVRSSLAGDLGKKGKILLAALH